MRHTQFSLLLLFLILVASASFVSADPVVVTNGGPAVTLTFLSSNSSVHGTATFSLSGNVLTIVMTNTSTTPAGEGVITGLGFDTTPNIVVSSASFSGSGSGWQYATNGGGLGGLEHRHSVSGIGNGLNPGQTMTAVLTLGNGFSGNLTIDLAKMHIQAIPPTGDSEKPTGTTRVPEPGTLSLLGLGLLVGRLCRRR